MAAKIPLTFRIFKGDELLRTETLSQSPIKIGKLSSSHLRLEEDESVSRMHAVIEVQGPGDITIIDLGSTKGTIVNGKKINKASLQDGDIILLGETKIVLSVGELEGADEEPTKVNANPAPTAPAPPAPLSATPPASPPAFNASQTGPSAAVTAPTLASPPTPAAVRAAVAPPLPPPTPSARVPQSTPLSGNTALASAPAPSFGLDASADLHGKRAIEVAAMLSDSVVAVKHITNPKTGKLSSQTMGLMAIGAAGILAAIITFVDAVLVAKQNKDAFQDWIDNPDPETHQKRDPIDFHETRLNPMMDVLALFGLVGGISCIVWARSRMMAEKESPYFRIGRKADVEFPVDSLPMHLDSFALVEPGAGDFMFNWTDGMKGEMQLDGKTTPLEQLPRSGPIPHKARIRVELGPNTFFVSSVPAPRAPASGFNIETAVAAFTGVSLGLHGLLVLLMYLIAPDTRGYSSDDLDNELRNTRVQIKPQEEPKQPDKPDNKKDDGRQEGGTGTKMAGDSGVMGKKDSPNKKGQYQMEKVDPTKDPQLAKMERLEKARTAGVLGVLNAQQGGAFASLTATGDFSNGLDDRDIKGGLIGDAPGEMNGGWGYGVSGTGAGGGGTGMGTIGLGRYGTIGHGAGTGTGYGIGGGPGGPHGRVPKGPMVSIGNATAEGDLDKNTIRRYIRQHISQIEYCYQKQLMVKPTLSGTVNTAFTIDGNGRVIAASAGGIGDGEVEGCIKDIIRGIEFPKPKGGGTVNVTSYPFTFRPTGG